MRFQQSRITVDFTVLVNPNVEETTTAVPRVINCFHSSLFFDVSAERSQPQLGQRPVRIGGIDADASIGWFHTVLNATTRTSDVRNIGDVRNGQFCAALDTGVLLRRHICSTALVRDKRRLGGCEEGRKNELLFR